jgi:short-subunit dehydrogenase
MATFHTKATVITGASRGLGQALARELAVRQWPLILDARGGEALERLAAELADHTEVMAIAGDVTDPARVRERSQRTGSHLSGAYDETC